jgi:hypothetical protein
MRKQWFDSRADDGQYFTIVMREERRYNINMWATEIRIWYEPISFASAKHKSKAMYGVMTKDEAIAMAKLLNATVGESK